MLRGSMKKLSIKIVVAIMLVAVFITAFAACEKAQKNLQVTFVSEDTTYAEATYLRGGT